MGDGAGAVPVHCAIHRVLMIYYVATAFLVLRNLFAWAMNGSRAGTRSRRPMVSA